MQFDPKAYGPEVAAILALDGDGDRLMPLVHASPPRSSHEAKAALAVLAQRKLLPEAALAGLYLYFSCWREAHEIAQNISTPEGSYWHAIVHRQEPDAGNAGYWFRQVGAHAIFPALREQAAQIGVDFGPRWDPIAFIEMCERARQQPGSEAGRSETESMAIRTQRAEWQLLFDYCAAKKHRA
jgi:hypothetical protein